MTKFKGWMQVAQSLRTLAETKRREPVDPSRTGWPLDEGQCASLEALAERITAHGALLADEVGMGKTRIAVALAHSVVAAGGRVAILVPPGLGFQWQEELLHGGLHCKPVLRSLAQYLSAWKEAEQADPWFQQQVVLVSHAFTNWKLSDKTPWRWALLPEVYAHWRRGRQDGGRFPRGYHQNEKKLYNQTVRRAAESIVDKAVADLRGPMARLLDEMTKETPWPGALEAEEYARDADLRPWLERAVGLGLGYFDLVIIDEAHKSRGVGAGLSRLLDGVILSETEGSQRTSGRRLSMTATPVELDSSQWQQALLRIGVAEQEVSRLQPIIAAFARTVAAVRERPTDPGARTAYQCAARTFQAALSAYVLRRDKRESASVRRFHEKSGLPFNAYREESQVSVDTAHLPLRWRQAVCAAEALSMLAQEDVKDTQRLRLTMGNGHRLEDKRMRHGLNAVIDAPTCDAQYDRKQLAHDAKEEEPPVVPGEAGEAADTPDKAAQRAQWWKGVLASALDGGVSTLYEHPGILAAVKAIEAVDAQDEKVLVFGRYTQPMRALVELLNARALLRRLDDRRFWPQARVHEGEWRALEAAHRQLGRTGALERPALDAWLHRQYGELEKERVRLRGQLVPRLRAGLQALPDAKHRARQLFAAFERAGQQELPALTKALAEMLGGATAQPAGEIGDKLWAEAFVELIEASSDRDEGDDNGDGELDDDQADELWATLAQRLCAEYDHRPEGGFARLMHGETAPPTRRLLQMAFNRIHGYPRVLVAQSLVGREGLNLHRACRTVVLLHPEWNPGVVEQQIGRVDRVGSLWEQLLDQALERDEAPSALPRIRILPVVFKGTYDEMNWRVLRQRWDELRAQLHGVVIPASTHRGDAAMDRLFDEINAAAPNFSPMRSV